MDYYQWQYNVSVGIDFISGRKFVDSCLIFYVAIKTYCLVPNVKSELDRILFEFACMG
jgi:hypothetical protein